MNKLLLSQPKHCSVVAPVLLPSLTGGRVRLILGCLLPTVDEIEASDGAKELLLGEIGAERTRLERSNDGSRSAGEGLCVLRSFLFTTQQEH